MGQFSPPSIADHNHELLARLVEVLAPGESDLVALIEAYFDESGSHAGSNALCVAGYLFEKEGVKRLDLEWKKVLDEFNLPYFRMSSCAHGNYPFDGRHVSERIEVEKRMISIIRDNMLYGAAVSVDEQEYNSWVAKRLIGSAYSYCCWQILAGISNWLRDNNVSADVAYFFEAGHASEGEADAIMRKIFSDNALKSTYRYVSHSFVDKQKVRPIQSADLLAWLHGNFLKKMASRQRPRSDYIALVKDKPYHVFIANRYTVGSLLISGHPDPVTNMISGSFGPFRFLVPI